jgi:hypothetical protein
MGQRNQFSLPLDLTAQRLPTIMAPAMAAAGFSTEFTRSFTEQALLRFAFSWYGAESARSANFKHLRVNSVELRVQFLRLKFEIVTRCAPPPAPPDNLFLICAINHQRASTAPPCLVSAMAADGACGLLIPGRLCYCTGSLRGEMPARCST